VAKRKKKEERNKKKKKKTPHKGPTRFQRRVRKRKKKGRLFQKKESHLNQTETVFP